MYTLTNKADSKWENYAVEIYQDTNSGFEGYKHYGASKIQGKPYCLGNTAFGSSQLHHDMFINEMPDEGRILSSDAAALIKEEDKFGRQLTEIVGGNEKTDFVFLFPCDEENEVAERKKELQSIALENDKDATTRTGVINEREHLGLKAKFGDPSWTHPHYCLLQEEPSLDPQLVCEEVRGCLYSDEGCLALDGEHCSDAGACKSGFCSEGTCGHVSAFVCSKLCSRMRCYKH